MAPLLPWAVLGVVLAAPAERWHEEYREDLAASRAQAEAGLVGAAGRDRARALVDLARLARLRGDFADAAALLTEAEEAAKVARDTEGEALVELERQWNASDRFTGPAELLDKQHEDVRCVWLDGAGQMGESHRRLAEIYKRWPPQETAALQRASGLNLLRDAHENYALQRDVLASYVRTEGPADPVVVGLRDQFRRFGPGEFTLPLRWSGRSEPAIGVLTRRLLARLLVLTHTPVSEDIPCAALSAARLEDPTLDGQDALTCAEAHLFPTGPAEVLGLALAPPTSNDSLFSVASRLWQGEEARARALAPATEQAALAELAAAEAGFRRAGNARGIARVLFVRAAYLLVKALTDATLVASAEDAAAAAEAANGAAEDLRVARHSRVLRAALRAIRRDGTGADTALAPILAHVQRQGAFAFGVGLARLLTALGSQRLFEAGDPEAADLLHLQAYALYRAAGGTVEGLDLQIRHAATIESSGDAVQARMILAQAIRPGATGIGCGERNEGAVLRRRLEALSRLILLANDAGDTEGLRGHLDAVRGVLTALGGGEQDLTRLGARFADAQLAQARTQALIEELMAAATTPTSDADELARRAERRQRYLGLREQMSRHSERLLDLAAVLSYRKGLVPQWEFMHQRLLDRAAIVRDPDLSPRRWYVASEAKAATLDPRTRRLIEALLAARRGEYERARARWRAERPSTSASDLLAILRQRAPGRYDRLALRQRFGEMTSDLSVLVGIRDYEAARAQLDAIATYWRELGVDGEWFDVMQEPWTYRADAVTVASGLGRHEEALRLARALLDGVDAARDAIAGERFRLVRAGKRTDPVHGAAVLAAAEAGRADMAFEFIERGKARGLRERATLAPDSPGGRLRALAQAILVLEEAIGGEAGRRAPRGPDPAPTALRLRELRAEYGRLLAQTPDTGAAAPVASARVVRDALPEDVLVLDYFIAEDVLVTVALTRGQAPIVHRQPVQAAVLEGQVIRLGRELLHPASSLAEADRRAEALAQTLLPPGPIRDLLRRRATARVWISAHEILHQVPFAFLPVDGRRLIERVTIQQLPFAGFASLPRPSRPRASEAAAVLAYAGDFGRLRRARAEAEAVAGIHDVEAKMAPTRTAVLDALRGAGIVHLTAHGRAPERGGYASVDLPRAGADDGDLSVIDVLSSRAPLAARTIVLAACELAVGVRGAGDEGVGLPRALLEKGAEAVVAPLWRVEDDEPLQALMTALHRELRRGASAAEALARVQRAALRERVEPRLWASLVAIGGGT